jgi:hypothetical protein
MDLSWRIYVPTSHMAVGFGGNFSLTADPRSVNRWLTGLVSTTREAHASANFSSRKGADLLEGYDYSQGVKARFQQKTEEAQVASAVRVSRPIVGRRYDFRANLLRAEAPAVNLWVLNRGFLNLLGWLCVVLAGLAAWATAERKRRQSAGMECGFPFTLALPAAGVAALCSLAVGLHLDDVVSRTALALCAAPAWWVSSHLRATWQPRARKLGWPPYVLAWGALGLGVFAAVSGESVLGTVFLLAVAYALARLSRRWLRLPPANTAAPPSGTPVAAAASSRGDA